jgi:DNA-binding PadR family transcriptional regulator
MPETSPTSQDFGPLTPAIYHILLALVEGERHGYSIMRDVAAFSNGQVHPGPTTLYRSIKQMLEQGLIIETEERRDPALDDERRRYYRMTPLGWQALRAETRRLAHLVELARAKGVLAGQDIPDIALGGAS